MKVKILMVFVSLAGLASPANSAFAWYELTKADDACSAAAEIYNNNGYQCVQCPMCSVWMCYGQGTDWTMRDEGGTCVAN